MEAEVVEEAVEGVVEVDRADDIILSPYLDSNPENNFDMPK